MKNEFCLRRRLMVLGFALAVGWPASGRAATFNVDIIGFSFQPASVTIQAGDTVTWTMKDTGTRHDVVSDTKLFSGPLLSIGQTWSHTFPSAGTFSYHCSPHPYMQGTILVKAPAAPANLSSPSRLDNGHFQFTVTGTAGQRYVLLASTTLADWNPVLTNTAPANTFTFEDNVALQFDYRFYRVVQMP